MNPLLNLIANSAVKTPRITVFMQALNAAKRGESPEEFIKNLAQQDPRFKDIDLNNLEQSAYQLCKQRGLDPELAKTQVESLVNSNL